jgi:hypothetical protein
MYETHPLSNIVVEPKQIMSPTERTSLLLLQSFQRTLTCHLNFPACARSSSLPAPLYNVFGRSRYVSSQCVEETTNNVVSTPDP